MKFILKNTTASPIEIYDMGLYISPLSELTIYENIDDSIDLHALVSNGDIVFANTDGSEKTIQESQTVINAATLPGYEQTYTKVEVDAKIAEILGGATTETLDTLSEIANALNNDPNIITALTDGLANKSDLTHNHDIDYADSTHNHDSAYTKTSDLTPLLAQKSDVAHNHSGSYSDISHNHDGRYALAAHDHNLNYYTKPQIDSLIGAISAPVFGQDYATARSDSMVTLYDPDNTHTKLTLSVTIANAGEYRLGWFYKFNWEKWDDQGFEGVIKHGSTVIDETIVGYYEKMHKASESGKIGNSGSEISETNSGFDHIYLTPGTHEFKIEFRPAGDDDEDRVSMWNARLEFWRTE